MLEPSKSPLADEQTYQRTPDLHGMFVPSTPPEGQRLAEVARASLALLAVAPDEVAVPVFAAVWRHRAGGGWLCERCRPPADASVVVERMATDGV